MANLIAVLVRGSAWLKAPYIFMNDDNLIGFFLNEFKQAVVDTLNEKFTDAGDELKKQIVNLSEWENKTKQ